jgi:hypothetical protein
MTLSEIIFILIIALLIATPASAKPWAEWQCGTKKIWVSRFAYTDITNEAKPKDLSSKLFKNKNGEKLSYKGRRCVLMGLNTPPCCRGTPPRKKGVTAQANPY